MGQNTALRVAAVALLIVATVALRATWETIPEAEAQDDQSASEALQSRLQESGPIQEPVSQRGADSPLKAGGPTHGPVPVVPDGSCAGSSPTWETGRATRERAGTRVDSVVLLPDDEGVGHHIP
jgi:hypothetical protein